MVEWKLCDLVESKKDWSSSKNTYLKTSERLAQEVLMTVGRGIVNDHLACDKKVPEKWFDKKSKLHKEMASDLWRGSNDGNSSSVAGYLVGEAIPRLWIHQLEESEAQFVKDYSAGGRAINRRYLDIWFGSGIRSWREVVKYCWKCVMVVGVVRIGSTRI